MLLLHTEGQAIGSAVKSAADQLGVSRSTVWRLLGLLRENDGRTSALMPKRSGPKRGMLRLHQQVEEVIDQVLRERYLLLERPSLRRIVGEIRAECDAKGFQPPSRQTVKARLDAMDQRKVTQKRKGAKAARQVFEAREGSLGVERPLEVGVERSWGSSGFLTVRDFEAPVQHSSSS